MIFWKNKKRLRKLWQIHEQKEEKKRKREDITETTETNDRKMDRTPEKSTDNLRKKKKTENSTYQEKEIHENENLVKEEKEIYGKEIEGCQVSTEKESHSKTTSNKNFFPIFQTIPSSIFKFKAVSQAGKIQEGGRIKAKNKANSAVSHHHPQPSTSKQRSKSKTPSNKSKPNSYLQAAWANMKPIHTYFKSVAAVNKESAPNQDKDFPPTPVQLSPS